MQYSSTLVSLLNVHSLLNAKILLLTYSIIQLCSILYTTFLLLFSWTETARLAVSVQEKKSKKWRTGSDIAELYCRLQVEKIKSFHHNKVVIKFTITSPPWQLWWNLVLRWITQRQWHGNLTVFISTSKEKTHYFFKKSSSS